MKSAAPRLLSLPAFLLVDARGPSKVTERFVDAVVSEERSRGFHEVAGEGSSLRSDAQETWREDETLHAAVDDAESLRRKR